MFVYRYIACGQYNIYYKMIKKFILYVDKKNSDYYLLLFPLLIFIVVLITTKII